MNWQQEHAERTARYMQMIADGVYKNGRELFERESAKACGVSPNPAIRQFKRFAERHPGECIALANIIGAETKTELAEYSKDERIKIAKVIKVAKVIAQYFIAPTSKRDFEQGETNDFSI